MKIHTPQPSFPVPFRLAILAGLLPLPLHAQLTWDTTTGDAVVTEGGGTWEVGVGNWWDGATDQLWADNDPAIFGGGTAGTADTVTLEGDVAPSTLRFIATAAGNYTLDLADHNITLGATTQNLTMGGSATATINASSGGKLFLRGTAATNSLTGTLTINAQVSEAVAGSRFYATGANTLRFRNPLNDFTGIFGKQNGGGGLIFDSIANKGLPSAAGAGEEVQIGTNGRVVYDGTGHSTDRALKLVGAGSGMFYSSGSGPIVWTGVDSFENTSGNNKTFTIRGTNTGANEIQGTIADNGANTLAITKTDAGTWIFSGANTYTAKTTLSGGILQANAADAAGVSGALGNGGVIDFNGGTLQYTALSAGTDYGSRFGDSASAIKLNTDGQDVTLTSIIDATNTGGLNKNGLGSLTLAGDNLYTGSTNINNGVLVTDAADVLDGIDPSITLSGALGAGGNIDFGGGALQYTANSAGTDYSARIVNSASPMTFDTNSQDVTLATALASSNTGGLTKEGAGTLTVKYSNGNYGGLTVVNGGTLNILKDDGGNTWTAGNFEINNGSTLEIHTTVTAVFQNRTWTFDSNGGGTIDLAGNVILQTANNTIVTTGGTTNTVSGAKYNMQNSNRINYNVADGTDDVDLTVSVSHERGSIIKDGAGTLEITSGVNPLRNDGTAVNTVTINAGRLILTGSGQIDTQGGTNGTWTGEVINDGIFEHSSTNNQVFSGVVSGAGSIVKSGTGTLTLSGENTYAGDTTVTDGILAVDGGAIPDTGSLIIDGTGKVEATGTEYVAALTLGGVVQTIEGTYGATGSGATFENDTYFTGTAGVVNLGAPTGFADWITGTFANGTVPGDEQGPDDDWDGDGTSNLIEYALDGFDPTVSDGSTSTTTGLLVTYTKRADASGISYALEESTDLSTWNPATPTTDDSAVITYTLTPPSPGKNFVRLVVTED